MMWNISAIEKNAPPDALTNIEYWTVYSNLDQNHLSPLVDAEM